MRAVLAILAALVAMTGTFLIAAFVTCTLTVLAGDIGVAAVGLPLGLALSVYVGYRAARFVLRNGLASGPDPVRTEVPREASQEIQDDHAGQ